MFYSRTSFGKAPMNKAALLVWFFLCTVSSYGQSVLVLENSKTGKKKKIEVNDRVKVAFSSAEKLKIRRPLFYAGDPQDYYFEGKVVAITDSVMRLKMPFRKDTFPVALNRIFSIQKYSISGRLGLLIPVDLAIIAGITTAGEPDNIVYPMLGFLVAGPLASLTERLVYPLRKVNRPDSKWKLSVARE